MFELPAWWDAWALSIGLAGVNLIGVALLVLWLLPAPPVAHPTPGAAGMLDATALLPVVMPRKPESQPAG